MLARNLTTILTGAMTLALIAGCSPQSSTPPAAQSRATPEPVAVKTGAELWAENCSRCHNFRPPQSFSEAQWHVIVHHMRLRANLTGQEARAITAFLQSTNQ